MSIQIKENEINIESPSKESDADTIKVHVDEQIKISASKQIIQNPCMNKVQDN